VDLLAFGRGIAYHRVGESRGEPESKPGQSGSWQSRSKVCHSFSMGTQAPLRVLVVDDVDDVAQMVADAIADVSPVPVITFVGFNGSEAVALPVEHSVNVAILDIEMPAMNGINATAAIRAAMPDSVPLLIAVTGHVNPSLDARIKIAAFDVVMRKPPDLERPLDHVTRH
jgi:CheY-like chemotaxis protein